MDNPFFPVRMELITGSRHRLADNYDEFVSKVTSAIITTMNETDVGQEIMDEAFGRAYRSGMTPEEWSNQKANFIVIVFWILLEGCPELMHEMARHLYNELRKVDENDRPCEEDRRDH